MRAAGSIRRGFTLVELMSSMAVGMVVLLVAVQMLGSTSDGYERLGGGVSAEREARALLGQLASDLSTAQYHKETIFKEGSEKWPMDEVGFLLLQSGDAQSDEGNVGDLCAVRYYLKDETIGGKTVRCLMRGFVESQDTFRALGNGLLGNVFAKPGGDASNTDEAIAFGVMSFEARPMVRDADGRLTEWKAGTDDPPEVLAVKLVIARRELMGKLRTSNDWNGNSNISSLMGAPADAARNKNFQVYETTIKFGNNE